MVPTFSVKKVSMSIHRFLKDIDEVLVCPFCQFPLTLSKHPQFKSLGLSGYNCFHCTVPGALAASGDKPYSRYSINVMEDVNIENRKFGQIIVAETFLIPIKDNKWYNVHNNLLKEQTNIVVVEPARQEHFYDGETIVGLAHIGTPVWFSLITNWNPEDQEATSEKIKTYMLFS